MGFKIQPFSIQVRCPDIQYMSALQAKAREALEWRTQWVIHNEWNRHIDWLLSVPLRFDAWGTTCTSARGVDECGSGFPPYK